MEPPTTDPSERPSLAVRSSSRPLWVAAGASFLLHGALVFGALLGAVLRMSVPPIPIEVRAVHRAVRRPVEPPRPPAPPTAPAPTKARPPHASVKKHGPAGAKKTPEPPVPKPAPPPPPPTLPAVSDLMPFSPGDAHLMLLLRTDRMRASPHRDAVEALLQAFPDYGTLFAGSGISALADLDALLIATSNVFDVTQTFIAARHANDGRVRSALQRRELPSWDPRRFRFPEPTLSVLARPLAPAPVTPLPLKKPLPSTAGKAPGAGQAPATDEAAIEDPRVVEERWLGNLRRFEQMVDAPGAPALLMTVEDLDALMRFGDGLPTPQVISLAISAEPSPALRMLLVFADPAGPARFVNAWPEVMHRYHQSADLLGLGPLFDGLLLTRNNQEVSIVGHLPEKTVGLALRLAQFFLSRNRVSSVLIPPAPSAVDEAAAARAESPDASLAPRVDPAVTPPTPVPQPSAPGPAPSTRAISDGGN